MELDRNPPDIGPQNNVNTNNIPPLQKRRKRKNKNKKQNKQLNVKKKIFKRKPYNNVNNAASKTVLTMTAWAEQFTFATTWQLKHQLAYWKAKAKSLEYENSVLHDIIRKNHYVNKDENTFRNSCNESDADHDDRRESETRSNMDDETSTVEEGKLGEWRTTEGFNARVQVMAVETRSEASEESADERHNFEVSEEFIQFLMVNARHKEEIRLERERLKAREEKEAMEERENKLKERRHYGLSAQQLYGDKWQKISALEMSMKSSFMSNMDSKKPGYWPVIPFNFDN